MKKTIALLSIFLVTLVSCTKDGEPENQTASILPKKIIFTDGSSSGEDVFKYNGNKLNEMINSYGEKTVYTYTGDLITKKTIYDDAVIKSTYDYTYEDGKLKSVLTSAYDKNKTTGIITVYQQKYVYIHNSNGTILEENFSIDPKTGTETKSDYSSIHTFSNGNLMKTFDTSSYKNTTSEYEYDNKKNPFVNITGFSKNNLNSVNNITKITTISKDTSNGVEVTTTTTRNYTNTYDINDFLTVRRLTRTASAGGVTVVNKGADEYFFYE